MLLFLCLGFTTIVSHHTEIVDSKVATYAEMQKVLTVSHRIQDGISQMQHYSATFLLKPDADVSLAYERGGQLFAQSADFLEGRVEDPEQLKRLENIRQLVTEIDTLNRYLIRLRKANKTEQAIRAFGAAPSQDLTRKLTRVLEDFIAGQHQLQAATEQETKAAVLSLNNGLWVASLGLTTLAIALGLWLAQQIAGTPIDVGTRVKSSAKDITHDIYLKQTAIKQQVEVLRETTALAEHLRVSSQNYAKQTEASTQQIEEIGGKIQQLSEQMAQVYELAHQVSSLASQTNLLALNAGVEAQRPSWPCHCFDVMAMKMRQLASESQKSADRLNALVNSLETGLHSSVSDTEQGTKIYEPLSRAIQRMNANAREIYQHSKQQAIAVQELFEQIDESYHHAAKTATGMSDTKIHLKKLNMATSHLQDML